MENSLNKRQSISWGDGESKEFVEVLEIPVFLSKSKVYYLPDMSYGQWLIFEKGEPRPKYYFNAFDERYAEKKDQMLRGGSVETYLEKTFKDKGLNLSLKNGGFGWALQWKFKYVDMYLEKLPLEYL